LIEADDVLITHVAKEPIVVIDDGKLVELARTKEFECANQVVVGAQENDLPIDEVIGQNERPQMFEILSILQVMK